MMGFSLVSTWILLTLQLDLMRERLARKDTASDLSWVFEPDLSRCHAAVLLQVRPWGVYYRHFVLFVAFSRSQKSM